LAPLFHVTGLIGHVCLAMLTGGPLVLFYRFDANEHARLTARHRATFTVSAITAYRALNSEAMAGTISVAHLFIRAARRRRRACSRTGTEPVCASSPCTA
jgi:long-chain acyl-CoA synthetase